MHEHVRHLNYLGCGIDNERERETDKDVTVKENTLHKSCGTINTKNWGNAMTSKVMLVVMWKAMGNRNID